MNYQRYWVITESSVQVFGARGLEDALAEMGYQKHQFNRKPHLLGEKEDDTLEEICTTPPNES